jgi:hypothetical protein
MKAQDIYHKMRAIAEDYHAYTDQLTAIAMWIEAEFEYKPQKQANGTNTSERQLTIPDVSNRRELLIAYGEWIHELAGCKDTEKATTLADSYLSNL